MDTRVFTKRGHMRVPKGTPLLTYQRVGQNTVLGEHGEVTKREAVVEIKDFHYVESWNDKLTAEEQAEYERLSDENRQALYAIHAKYRTQSWTCPRTGAVHENYDVPIELKEKYSNELTENYRQDEEIKKRFEDLGYSRFVFDDIVVSWGSDYKKAWLRYMEPVEKSEVKTRKTTINKRQQMVNKSRWKFTETRDIKGIIENPKFWPAIHAVNADPNFDRPDWDHTNPQASQAALAAWQSRRDLEIARLCPEGQYIEAVIYQAKAGEIIEVEGKFQKSWSGKNGDIFVAKLENGNTTRFPYKSVESYLEPESIPTVKIWVLREKSSGKFYHSSEYDRSASILSGKDVYDPILVDNFMKAKHFDSLGRAKTQILMMTGYYNGLAGAEEALPEWAGGGGFVLDDKWELVEFDKLNRQEVGVVPNFQEWYKRSWELRSLTMRYGSSVRSCYKELEKANLLDQQKGMLVFTVTDEDALDNLGYYGDRSAVTEEDKAAVDAAIKAAGLKKGQFKKSQDAKSVAVSFPNKGAAMLFKLGYSGNLKTTVIDLEEMKEAVDV